MLTAVVTDHWAVLSPRVENVNTTCEAAHFGLWRLCKKYIYIEDAELVGKGCGPISLPGEINCSYFRHFTPGEDSEIFEVKTQREINCSYFRHFTPGEDSEIFEVKTQREYNISAAAIAIFSLVFMILGTLCVLGSLRKGKDYLYKPAGMFFAFAGLCAIISVEVMRQSVKRMIESEFTIWIEYYYSWSFACACTGFVLLLLSGIGLLLVSMPQMPRNPWETCMDAEPEQI
ncbi:Voltage-dependent calcium channel gamma-1 subunit [Anabarilius grahami]|uniref:Voltage-dependent calcium channel gamma-1 subunit n=1 Tax=Anabarilius grahami TaxID=495550 RepID=A0A3N0YHE3_ANAGA|nr:Voltage-dependent calcium channel gamma-1 subunit [Anabarilius grahami]